MRSRFCARGYPLMSNHEALSVLIVGSAALSASLLRTCLLEAGCYVHVVGSMSAALMIADRRKVDVVLLEYSEGHATRSFCAALAELDIPHIFTTGLDDPHAGSPSDQLSKVASLAELRIS